MNKIRLIILALYLIVIVVMVSFIYHVNGKYSIDEPVITTGWLTWVSERGIVCASWVDDINDPALAEIKDNKYILTFKPVKEIK